ncbi:heavy-metal-associated domain-containing protein [Limnospira platensis CENA597]|uniref:heavy-metal-associated domain-containing protein n=1 Tax=Limnospira platensis TaxID=118562 RepID=UPI003D6FDAB7
MTIKLTVSSMVCDACANSVTKAIHTVDSDATVNIDLNTKMVTVEATASESALRAAIAKAGHTTES